MMTPAEFASRMQALRTGDTEVDHGNMDDLMAEVLTELGYGIGVAIWQHVERWYA